MNRWRKKVKQLKLETYALYLAYRDPRTPWYARVVAALVVGYLFSPLDLIPDFIPGLGLLDDLLLVPLGIVLARRLVPVAVMIECRNKAAALASQPRPVNRVAAAIIILVWLALAALSVVFIARLFS